MSTEFLIGLICGGVPMLVLGMAVGYGQGLRDRNIPPPPRKGPMD